MKFVQIFCSCLIAACVLRPANAIQFTTLSQSANNNCTNAEYRRAHPDKCPSFLGAATAPILSGATVLGGALALIGLANAANSDDTHSTYYQPTLPSYNMVGGDIDNIQLAAATATPEYTLNATIYDDIRLSYSIARGYTGAGTNIAVLDAGMDSWHGRFVTNIISSGPIAPDANVTSYKIAYNMDFVPYSEIGDVINSASDANVFNASWSVPMRATELKSREQLIRITDENFVSSLSNAATNRDAIFVWAAGNDAHSQSSALSAIPTVMPEMQGHFINVVAWDSTTGTLAKYSNACGITSQWCITAPGTDITNGITTASGTSFAAPLVSAAIAVIRQAFPYMSAPDITSLLFETARDLGAPGIDAIYGHGMLDLERATRPVGAPLVPIDGGGMQPIQTARISGAIAQRISDANPQFAYFDKYGRAFNANLSDFISVQNQGIGFQRLRAKRDITIADIGNFEMGLKNSDIAFADGMMQTRGNDWFGFVGAHGDIDIGNINVFQRTRISFGTPQTTQNSIINNFSNIYTAAIDIGAKYGDWIFGVSIPDTIIGGTMNLRTPVGRAATGAILYNDYAIDMRTRPSIEYSISYKSITASFVDNPYGTDEFFILTRGRMAF